MIDYALLASNLLTIVIWVMAISWGFRLSRAIGPIPRFWWFMLAAMGIWFARAVGFVFAVVAPGFFGPWDFLDNTIFPVADAALLGCAIFEMNRTFGQQLGGIRSQRDGNYPIAD